MNVFAVNTGCSVTLPYLFCTLVPNAYVVPAAHAPEFACGFQPPNVYPVLLADGSVSVDVILYFIGFVAPVPSVPPYVVMSKLIVYSIDAQVACSVTLPQLPSSDMPSPNRSFEFAHQVPGSSSSDANAFQPLNV